MFFIKIFHFFKGYVILSVAGNNKETFLNEILRLGVNPYSVKTGGDSFIIKMSLSDFFKIRGAKSHVKIYIEKKSGAVFLWKKLRKRYFLLLGAVLLALSFFVGGQFIWTVEIDGDAENSEELYSALKIAGVKPGTFKPLMKPPLEVKNIVINNAEDISWAWLYVKGTKAVLKVRRNITAPEISKYDTACDIVAARSGVIKRVITKRGVCKVSENQTVMPGDVIISGTFEFDDKPGYTVHASGEVEAYTTHTLEGTYKQYCCYKTYTGRKRRFITLNIFGKKIPLYMNGKVKFENFDEDIQKHELKTGKRVFGAEIRVCSEYNLYKEQISYDAAADAAKNELEAKISAELLPGAKLIDKNADVKRIDDETISVRVTMDFIENIGTEKRIEEVKIVEPKTDKSAGGD